MSVIPRNGKDVERCSNSKCNLQAKLNEVTRINHIWQKDYTSLLAEANNTKIRLRSVEKQLDVSHDLNAVLKTENTEWRNYIEKKDDKPISPSKEAGQNIVKDELEALKQQLNVYKEDFDRERKDKDELEVKLKAIKRDLGTSLKTIDKMKEENNDLRLRCRKTNSEKEGILSELRRLTTIPPGYFEEKTFNRKLVERDKIT